MKKPKSITYYLIYASKAIAPMSECDLLMLLAEARSRNKDHNVTGMLLYIQLDSIIPEDGGFIQFLEGDESSVRAIFEKIRTDKRHKDILVLNGGRMTRRCFSGWYMGFRPVVAENLAVHEGYIELDKKLFQRYNTPRKFNRALNTLKSIYA